MFNITRDSRPDENGFTLLEVLLAIAVLAIALPVLLGLRNFDMDLHERARQMTEATLLAQEKMLESELAGVYPIGETTGEFLNAPLGAPLTTQAFERPVGYRWKRIVSPTPLHTVREVRITVSWLRGLKQESLEVSTYVMAGKTS